MPGGLQDQSVIRAGDTVFVVTRRPPCGATDMDLRPEVLGCSAAWSDAVRDVRRAADYGCRLLLLGETGTGKGVLAGCFHEWAGTGGTLVQVDCPGIPDSLFEPTLFGSRRGAYTGSRENTVGFAERAHHGTLFLDEIADLEFRTQEKLLVFLDRMTVTPVGSSTAKDVRVRVVAATNREGALERCPAGMKQELWSRLAGVVVRIPPLRARREDIGPLAWAAVESSGMKPAEVLTDRVVEKLLLCPWRGNARDVWNLLSQGLSSDELMAKLNREPEYKMPGDSVTLPTGRSTVAPDSPMGGVSEQAPVPTGRRSVPRGGGPYEVVESMVGTALSVRSVASETGWDRRTVKRWIERAGLVMQDGVWERNGVPRTMRSETAASKSIGACPDDASGTTNEGGNGDGGAAPGSALPGGGIALIAISDYLQLYGDISIYPKISGMICGAGQRLWASSGR